MKYESWIKSVRYLLTHRLKISKKPNTIITVDKIVNVGYDYLVNKFPNNFNIEATIKNTLNKLVKSRYLKKVKSGYKVNGEYDKPIQYMPTKIGSGVRLGECVIEKINGILYANYHGIRYKFAEGI